MRCCGVLRSTSNCGVKANLINYFLLRSLSRVWGWSEIFMKLKAKHIDTIASWTRAFVYIFFFNYHFMIFSSLPSPSRVSRLIFSPHARLFDCGWLYIFNFTHATLISSVALLLRCLLIVNYSFFWSWSLVLVMVLFENSRRSHHRRTLNLCVFPVESPICSATKTRHLFHGSRVLPSSSTFSLFTYVPISFLHISCAAVVSLPVLCWASTTASEGLKVAQ